MIILKVTKNQGFTISLEDTFFENHRGGQIEKFFDKVKLDLQSWVPCSNLTSRFYKDDFMKIT